MRNLKCALKRGDAGRTLRQGARLTAFIELIHEPPVDPLASDASPHEAHPPRVRQDLSTGSVVRAASASVLGAMRGPKSLDDQPAEIGAFLAAGITCAVRPSIRQS